MAGHNLINYHNICSQWNKVNMRDFRKKGHGKRDLKQPTSDISGYWLVLFSKLKTAFFYFYFIFLNFFYRGNCLGCLNASYAYEIETLRNVVPCINIYRPTLISLWSCFISGAIRCTTLSNQSINRSYQVSYDIMVNWMSQTSSTVDGENITNVIMKVFDSIRQPLSCLARISNIGTQPL